MTELGCQELVELVTDYLDRALDDETRQRFEAHLRECDGCERYLAQLRRTVQLVGDVPGEVLSEAARSRLLAAFRNWKRVS
jgi:anti-sigma factor RsiW